MSVEPRVRTRMSTVDSRRQIVVDRQSSSVVDNGGLDAPELEVEVEVDRTIARSRDRTRCVRGDSPMCTTMSWPRVCVHVRAWGVAGRIYVE